MRLRCEDDYIKKHRLDGLTGLELETHRVTEDGDLSQTEHPFPGHPYIDRDFSEAQMEINTPPADDPASALAFLREQLGEIHARLEERKELLWPFSNPPVLHGEENIPIARYYGEQAPSYYYRVYLSERYGKYKMTYSGIHFNYSFAEDLLRHNYELDRAEGVYKESDFPEYKDRFYLKLAEKSVGYSWVVVSLLSASPLVDNSFYEEKRSHETLFTGFSSLRNSEFGYWNPFLAILSYDTVESYVQSIEKYLDMGLLIQARELYFPVRVKPPGMYTLQALRDSGVSHIEFRQVDLNPFAEAGADVRDMEFLKLFLVWLASLDDKPLNEQDQMQALQNHKAASAFDWDLARITMPGEETKTLREALAVILDQMRVFYEGDACALDQIQYQSGKVESEDNRYACRVRNSFGKDYIGLGLERAREIQEMLHV